MSEQHARHEDEAGRHRAGSDSAPPHRYTAPLADAIERRWQQAWDDAGIFRVANPGEPGFDASRPKFYVLDMFPYPSGSGLHVGHPEGYTATDILARFKRMQGFNVLHPMGWDAFGLPAEQYAVETNVHPATTTRKAIDTFRRQLKRFGFSYDWSREVSTIDPGYYKWTQWIWLRGYNSWFDPRAHAPGAASKGRARPIETLLEDLANERLLVGPSGELVDAAAAAPLGALSGGARGGGAAGGVYREWAELTDDERHAVVDAQRLAYLGEQTVNWCPALGTVLANEEVIDGRSERGGHPVKRVALRQWMFRITAFAERLLEDLAHVDWPESTRTQQTDWIGRSEGAEIDFALDSGSPIRVFTTRPDTLFGATYVVLAPEHPLINDIVGGAQRHAVAEYLQKVASRSDIERQEGKEKTGVFTGAFARNPATGEPVPVWVADYVLPGYGTGAIMAVPAHDERDFEFARAFGLPIRDAVHTAPLAALRAFAARYDPARLQGMDAIGLAADFVGLCVSHSRSDYDAVWEDVQRQRTRCELGEGERRPGVIDASQLLSGAATAEGLLGAAGRDRRGSVAFVWREALHDLFGEDVEPLISAARDGRLVDLLNSPVSEPGVGANSSNAGVSLDGLHTADAKARIVGWLEREGHGERKVTYKLRDWLFSRQRYWGEPFPVVYDDLGRAHALPESDLPVELPPIDDFRPVISDSPSPPLGRAKDWVSVTRGGKTYRRETNTMPNWAGSCWYYLRYCDPANKARFVSPEAERYWMGPSDSNPHGGVDLYMGGAEHAVLHLLYARFWHKMLYDLGEVTTPEPFRRLRHQGLILSFAYQRANATLVPSDQVADAGEGRFVESATGERVTQVVAKMSKSLKNVVNPDDVIAEFGADTFRLYEMAMGPIEASKPWNPRDIVGPHRFLQRLWRLVVDEETGALRARADHPPDPKVERALHRVIKKVGHDVEALSFNTAIAAMIEFVNEATGPGVTPAQANRFVRVIAPFAPHIAEELWSRLGHTGFVSSEPWPAYDEAALAESEVEIAVQVNGKVRGKITVPAGADDKALEAAALADPKAAEWTQGKPARKVIVVKGRLVNIVV